MSDLALPKTIKECEEWNDSKSWWEPVFYCEGMEYFESDENTEIYGIKANWLCDHLGDATENMNRLFIEFLKLKRKLDK